MSENFNFRLMEGDKEKIDRALELSGLRSRSELIRFLLTQYLREWYSDETNERL